MPAYRKERLEEAIKRIVAETLMRDIKDPRIGFVTVTRVQLNRDKTVANVYVSVMGDERSRKSTMAGLMSAGGFIKHQVGKNIKMRIIPGIKFFLDKSIEYESEMVNLLNSLGEERKEKDEDNFKEQ